MEGIDLSIVGDEAKRLGQFPGRKGIGGKPGMHQTERTDNLFVVEVWIIGSNLLAGELSFVNNYFVRK